MSQSAPLNGIRVIDLSRALAGPLAASILGDFGADVIKVEPKKGDPSRAWAPRHEGESLYHAAVNRNKRSVAVDFRVAAALPLIRRLIDTADVVIESFRPGVMMEMGLDPEELRAANPRLVIISISGFGSLGPYRDRPGLDQVAQAMSGLMSVTGADADNPLRVGVPIVDFMTGIHAALAAAVGLAGRGDQNAGSHIETSLLETALASLVFQAQGYLTTGVVPEPQGNSHPTIAPYGSFATRTAPIIISVGTERQWISLLQVLGREDVAEDPRFSTEARIVHRRELDDMLEAELVRADAEYWLERFQAVGIPCGPINTLDQVFVNPQVEALGIVRDVGRDDGWSSRMLASPFRIDGQRPEIAEAPPVLGRHTVEVLTEIGVTANEIRGLVDRGVVGGEVG